MKVLNLAAALVVAAIGAAQGNTIVDDSTCVWKTTSCQPSALCSFQLHKGDLTLSQSCRVKDGVNYYPQQIHLAYAGETGTGMTISWATFETVSDSTVWIGTSASALSKSSASVKTSSYFADDDYEMMHHHATISGLKPHTKYYYKVGSAADTTYQSDVASFVTARASTDTSTFKMVIYGDLGDGDNGATTIDYMNSLTSSDIDFIYHLGDVSYADTDYLVASQVSGFFYEEVYNKWMNSLMTIMSQVPYMVLPGNHESECHSPYCQLSSSKKDQLGNYTAFNNRFKMPSSESGGTLNMWYSFNDGPIHITSISSETDYPNAPTNEWTLTHHNGDFGDQLSWLEADLKKADANRANVPWVLVGMHRPMYASTFADAKGLPNDEQTIAVQAAFEELFIKYKVDVVLTAHKHYYERHAPVARNESVLTGVSSDYKTYTNVQAPVHILTAAGGNVEGLADAPANNAPWTLAKNYEKFGFSLLTASKTSLKWQYLASSDQTVLDEFVMTKS